MATAPSDMRSLLQKAKERAFSSQAELTTPQDAAQLAGLLQRARAIAGVEPARDPEVGLQLDQQELGAPGLDAPMLRARIRRRIGFGTPDEDELFNALKLLRDRFPQGDLRIVSTTPKAAEPPDLSEPGSYMGRGQIPVPTDPTPAEDVLVFRESPDQPYKRLDAKAGEKFEPLNDLADVFGSLGEDLGAIVGEVAAIAGTRGSALPARLLATFFGAAGGDVAQQLAEGEGAPSLERAASQGMIASVGGEGGEAVLRTGRNAVRGAGVFGTSTEGRAALAASQRLSERTGVEIPAPPAGITTSNPIIARISRQSAALVSTINEAVQRVEDSVQRAVRTLRSPEDSTNLRARLLQAEAKARQELRTRLVTERRVSMEEGGSAIAQAAQEYEQSSQAYVSQLYAEAKKQASPDTSTVMPKLRAELRDIEQGISFATRKEDTHSVIIDQNGNPIVTGEAPGSVERITQLEGDLQRVIGQIASADDALPPITIATAKGERVVSAIDQLQAWRTQLFELKTPAPGEPYREAHRLAGRAYAAITDAIEGAADSPAWKRANAAARLRFETLEETAMVAALKAGESREFTNYARFLVDRADPRQLRVLRRSLPERDYRVLQEAFKSELLRKPSGIGARLDEMDEGALGMLMSRDERDAYRIFGEQMARIEKGGIRQLATEASNIGAEIRRRIAAGDQGFVDELSAAIVRNGGYGGPLARAIRAGVIDDIINSAIRTKGARRTMTGGSALDFNVITEALNELNRGRGLRFLGVSDIKKLIDAKSVQRVLKLGADAGTSIRAAEISADVMEAKGSAWLDMAIAYGWGYVMTAPVSRRLLAGSGAKDLQVSGLLRGLSAASALLATDVEKSAAGLEEVRRILPQTDQ